MRLVSFSPKGAGSRALGILEMVANLGTIGEKAVRIDGQQPYRDELKAIMNDVRVALTR